MDQTLSGAGGEPGPNDPMQSIFKLMQQINVRLDKLENARDLSASQQPQQQSYQREHLPAYQRSNSADVPTFSNNIVANASSDLFAEYSLFEGQNSAQFRNSRMPQGIPQRRQSMYARQQEQEDYQRSQLPSIFSAQYYKLPPPTDHISLNSLTVPSAIKFQRDIEEYYNMNRIVLQPSSFISFSIRGMLLSHISNIDYVSADTFLILKPMEIFGLIRRYVSPKSIDSFYRILKEKVKFNWYGELNAVNFDIFYQKALFFIEDFRYWVLYMSVDNEVNTPNVDNKEGGLIKLFCQQFPNDYARYFVNALRDKKFESLDEFFVVFKAKLKSSRDIFKASSDELCRFDMGHEEKKMRYVEENSFGPNNSFTSKDASVSYAVGNTAASLDALDVSELQGEEQPALIEDTSEVVKPSSNDVKELIFQPSRPLLWT